MKKIVVFFLLFSGLATAQVVASEEHPKMIYTEKAQFPGGEEAFRAEFHKIVNGYIDLR